MCTCGCGDLRPSKVFKIDDNKYLVYELYPGCQDCTKTVVVSLHFFNNEGFKSYLEGEPVTVVEFDEYGGSRFDSIVFDIDKDLVPAMTDHHLEDYDSVADLFHDQGLCIVQSAIISAKTKEERKTPTPSMGMQK